MARLPKPIIDTDIDFKKVQFGKYKNQKTPEVISEEDPGYLIWAYREYGINFCSTALYVDTMDTGLYGD